MAEMQCPQQYQGSIDAPSAEYCNWRMAATHKMKPAARTTGVQQDTALDPALQCDLPDDQFLQTIRWSRRAPKQVVNAARAGRIEEVCRWLRQELTRGSLGRSTESGLEWSRGVYAESSRAADFAALYCGVKNRRKGLAPALNEWLSESDGERLEPFAVLVLQDVLRRRAGDLPDALLLSVCRRVLGASAWSTGGQPAAGASAEDRRILATGEIPWRSGLLFDCIEGADILRARGQQVLRRALLDGTDTDGMPQAALVERLGFWLAPLIRAALWGRDYRTPLWNGEGESRFRALMKAVSPLCLGGARLALSNGYASDRSSMLKAGLQLAGWSQTQPPQRAVTIATRSSARNGSAPKVAARGRRVPSPGGQSDWARLGCLRSAWSPDADALIVAHHARLPQIELACFGRTILSGDWGLELSVGGTPVPLRDEWFCVCWHTDSDGDYLELQMRLGARLRVERQLFLSRSDHFAVLSDVVSGAGESQIDLTSRLPLGAAVTAETEVRTRECRLSGRGSTLRVFPLAFAADRVTGEAGGLRPQGQVLEVVHSGLGGLYSPLFLDWHPRRRKSEADWRRLTVTEDRRTLGPRDASGYRLRIGKQQWLIYRSLTRAAEPRAVLGHHTANETVLGEFVKSGEVTPLVMVE